MSIYRVLSKQEFIFDQYKLVPIRMEDRFNIMKWRNEQLYHLRQNKPLTEDDQEIYFKNVVAKLFEQEQPIQVLFSYLEGEKCIGYGGLVHINWLDKNAEISFIMDTALEEDHFQKHWGIFLELLENAAFDELVLHKIYTWAFDLRPQLYDAIEAKGFEKEAVLKDHCLINGEFYDVVIHMKINQQIFLRKMLFEDKKIVFNWSNDFNTRLQSFNSEIISFDEHSTWFDKKLNAENADYFICVLNKTPAGLIRFDEKENYVLIGINIAPEFRGKKLASIFLQKGCKFYLKNKDLPIKAFIKKDNIASVKAFENAGFKLVNDVIINNIESYEYNYNQ